MRDRDAQLTGKLLSEFFLLMTYCSQLLYSVLMRELPYQPLSTSGQSPPNCSSPSVQDTRLSSEICHIRASLACQINTFSFSFFYPGWVLNCCTFVNSQKHEQNDRRITNANVFVANKSCHFLSSVLGKGLCTNHLKLRSQGKGASATQGSLRSNCC